MFKGQKSSYNGIENFLCPFTDMYISQGSNGAYSHKGIFANDVRGKVAGIKYPYYSPCKLRCLKTYSESGQVMWQSVNKVRFANGRIDFATLMTAHDDSMDAYVGQIVEQGEQLGNMGTKGNATGVHCHIEVSQSKDTSWMINQYGNYHFNNEYDLDDCFFVDNTNILHGMNGNWKKTTDIVNLLEDEFDDNNIDQVLVKGSLVKFDGIFKVDIIKSPINLNLFGCCELTGCLLEDYEKERVKDYHWIPLKDFIEVDQYGNSDGQDDLVIGGHSYVINKNVYKVVDIDVNSDSAKLNIDGKNVWIKSKYLYEISDN